MKRFERRKERHRSTNASTEITWVPPMAKNRDGKEAADDDVILKREQRRLQQRQKHRDLIKSMDVVLSPGGFLIPRQHESEEHTDTINHEGDESMSSIPYCKLSEEPPETPSSNPHAKSVTTLATQSTTLTNSASSRNESFSTPRQKRGRTISVGIFHSPAEHLSVDFFAPFLNENQSTGFVSPLADPSPRKMSTVVEPEEQIFHFKRHRPKTCQRKATLSHHQEDVDTTKQPSLPKRASKSALNANINASAWKNTKFLRLEGSNPKHTSPDRRPTRISSKSPPPRTRLRRKSLEKSEILQSCNPRLVPSRLARAKSEPQNARSARDRRPSLQEQDELAQTWIRNPSKSSKTKTRSQRSTKDHIHIKGMIDSKKKHSLVQSAPKDRSSSSRVTDRTLRTVPTFDSSTAMSTKSEALRQSGLEEERYLKDLSLRSSLTRNSATTSISTLDGIEDLTIDESLSHPSFDEISEDGAVVIKTRKVYKGKRSIYE